MDCTNDRIVFMALRAGELRAQDLIDFSYNVEASGELTKFIEKSVKQYNAGEETLYDDIPFDSFAEQTLMGAYPKRDVICIYADDTSLFSDSYLNGNNLIEIEVPRYHLKHWYDLKVANAYPIDMTYERWLCEESTADETDGLWNFCKEQGCQPLICGL